MENHPIPQDVTGFKFKLIGSITVKQFLYLLGFGILATVVFVLQINIVFKVPLMMLFAGIGAALAFIPIEGRPMDMMLVNFAKTIPSENRYIFKKRGANLASFPIFSTVKPKVSASLITAHEQKTRDENADRRAMLISRLRNSSLRPDQADARVINNIHTFLTDSSTQVTSPLVMKQPIKVDVSPDNSSTTEAEKLNQKRLDAIEQSVNEKGTQEQSAPTANPPTRNASQSDAGGQPQTPNLKLSNETSGQTSDIPKESQASMPEKSNPTLTGGFPTLPDVGNVVLGIVRDARGKTLPNILVEVIDSNNTPVRAFKTNALGQFASATQLSNGIYKVLFSDASKQHEFQPIDINLTGEIFQPIEATSTDAREKLRQELFGGAAA